VWLDARTTCESRFVVEGILFENLIALTDPGDKQLAMHDVPYDWNKTVWSTIVGRILRANLSSQRVAVTVVGMFETRVPLKSLVNRRLPMTRMGFGDDNLAPAQILPKEFKAVRVVP